LKDGKKKMKYRFKLIALLCALALVIGCGDKPVGSGDGAGGDTGDTTEEMEENAGEMEEPAGEEPAGEEPAGEEPAGEEPAGEEPAGEEPAGESEDE
jgi:hypothetical protein